MKIKFSFIICTCNSSRMIQEVLSSILNQTEKSNIYEIIIVDFNSKDFTMDLARKFLKNSNINFREVYCNTPGKSPALKQGLDLALGDYIIIVDDDNILYPNYLKIAQMILKDQNIGCVGARGVADKNLSLSDWFYEYESVYAIGLPQGEDWVWGAASIINRKAWTKLKKHRFNFILNPVRKGKSEPIAVGGEDVELSLAIQLAGYKIVTNSNLKFIHKFSQNRIDKNYLIKNSEGVSKAVSVHEMYRLLLKNPETISPKFWWSYQIIRKIIGCIINIFISFFLGKTLRRQVTFGTLKGITLGYVKFYNSFDFDYIKLKDILNE